jgi:RsiW-degrading membrane proteinase PrsW (M82 family)
MTQEETVATTPPTSEAAQPNAGKTASAWTVLALVTGVAGLVLGVGAAALVSLILILSPEGPGPGVVTVVTILGLALLGAPLAWHAWSRLRGNPPLAWQARPSWIVAGGVLIAASLLCGQASLSLNLLPTLIPGLAQYLAVLSPAAILLALTAGSWAGFSALRAWGHLISGAWLAVVLSFVAEVIVIGVLAVLGLAVLITLAPAEFEVLLQRLQTFQTTENFDLLSDWLFTPWMIAGVLVTASIALPAIEEALKPLGVILMLGRRPTPMAAFLGGMMGGLGFAVVESLTNLSATQDGWLGLVVARIGTMVMHGLTAGLVGWGWGQVAVHRARGALRLAAAYLTAVTIHGLWNAAAVIIAFGSLSVLGQSTTIPQQAIWGVLMALGLIVLVGLTLAAVAGLMVIGSRLRQVEPATEP